MSAPVTAIIALDLKFYIDCGPMSGFDNAKVNEEFFRAGDADQQLDQEFFPEGHLKSNFLLQPGLRRSGHAASAAAAPLVRRRVLDSLSWA
jgi:hypothetical protein